MPASCVVLSLELAKGEPLTQGRAQEGAHAPALPEVAPGARLLVVCVGEQLLAFPLARVERVIAAAHAPPLPGAPTSILGALDLEGEPVPVLDTRRKLGLAERPLRSSDQFVLARRARGRLAFRVDRVVGVAPAETLVEAGELSRQEPFLRGSARLEEGPALALVCALEGWLSPAEERALQAALERRS